MPIAGNLLARFSPEGFYHIICKCIDARMLFKSDENRRYFLRKYHDFLFDFIDTYAYSLLDNHVHWLIKVKPQEEILPYLQKQLKPTITHKKFLNEECDFHELIEQQFNRFFIAYSLAFNIQSGVKGHLFSRPFKRIEITDDFHLTQLIIYIHVNAEKHGKIKDFNKYGWSSYPAMISDKFTHLKREMVIDWFGGKDRFVNIHQEQAAFYYNHPLSGE